GGGGRVVAGMGGQRAARPGRRGGGPRAGGAPAPSLRLGSPRVALLVGAAAAVPTTATAAAMAAAATAFAVAGLAHVDGPALQLAAVQVGDRFLGLAGGAHLTEAEAARPARGPAAACAARAA